jgi:hypothetical protein
MGEHITYLRGSWRQVVVGSLIVAGAMSTLVLLGALIA